MPIHFDETEIYISGQALMIESASLTSENTLSPITVLGRYRNISQIYSGPMTHTLQMNYYLELNNTINENILSMVTGNLRPAHPVVIKAGGLSGTFYLTNYSLDIPPQAPARATVNYVAYMPLSGTLVNSNLADKNTLYNTGLAHGWTTYIGSIDDNFYDFRYNFTADIKPIYGIGKFPLYRNAYPIQVILLGARQSVTMVKDVYTGLSYSGNSAATYLDGLTTGVMSGLYAYYDPIEANYSLPINMEKYQMTRVEVNFNPTDIITITTELTNVLY